MEITISPNYDEMSKAAAQVVAELVKSKPNAVLGLATGSSPLGLYGELIRMHREDGLDFSKVRSFNLDEYVGLRPEHEQSYRYFMEKNLFDDLNIKKENTRVPSGTAEDYAKHCEEYEQEIRQAGGIDLQVLGIGSDGHIGFNEPGTSLASRTHVTVLTQQTIADNARFFEKKEDVPIRACTMGVGTVLETRKCILLASGKGKVKAIAQALEGPVTSMCTASALQLHPDTSVFLDQEAASGLKLLDYYKWVQQNR